MTVTETPEQAADRTRAQVAETLDAIRRHRRFSDRVLAERAGMTRPAVEARRRGATPCGVTDLAKLAIGLNVEPEVFFLSPDDAIRWVLDHRPAVLGDVWAARDSNSEPAVSDARELAAA